ncbi:DUF3592 domain-containing protein [Polyangium mundeleinium]|uniref:DUF3592 domain-containing protein n=1 Tax=Polyangium mundeleinium TaxID=2995306 RepID=A0ABT5EPH6_9BACT|nr:DUF3592 domain-containing protein [Polyangium mundeleinium]MDC0743745.1 DUF3592 domain-containing protein [Polyangium mundeleinium]
MFSPVGISVAAGISALAGLVEIVRAARLVRVGKIATARVVANTSSELDDDDPPPKLRFRTEDGLDIEVVERTRNADDDARIGAEVPVLYDPRDPQRARRNASAQIWGPGLVWIAFAALLGVAAAVQALVT